MDETISLNKFISDTGYCSRRKADNLITAGRVLLNDKVAQLGNRYKPGDTVEVDGSLITAAKKDKRVYLALNKPVGITSTTELQVKDNIITFVGYPKRIFPIGRLDKDSEGLIFLTNDGDIINKILRAGNNHEKEYLVRVNKPIDNAFVQQMSQGVPILGTQTLPCKVQLVGRQTFKIILTQGLNRQIRRMCEYLGYAVVGLQRTRIMNIKLDKLPVGKWRYLSEAEMNILLNSIDDSSADADSETSGKRKKKTTTGFVEQPKTARANTKQADKPAATNFRSAGKGKAPAAGDKFSRENPRYAADKGKPASGKSKAGGKESSASDKDRFSKGKPKFTAEKGKPPFAADKGKPSFGKGAGARKGKTAATSPNEHTKKTSFKDFRTKGRKR